VLWFAIPFYQKGIASLKNGNLNMFTLLCLGIAIPYAYSLCSLLTNTFITRQLLMNHNVFFESSAVIGTLAWLGQYLEALARVQSSGSLKELMALAPNTATILLPDQSEKTIAISEISAHMKVVVKPGERIPVDGAVISGVSTVDESMLTGEYLPTTKLPGNEVSAGTLNKNGSLTIDTEKVGEDTRLAQIVALVGQAQRSRVPAQQLADKISACFVPLVLAIAAITYFAWLAHGDDISQSVLAGVAVLVVACPCALGLATPMAIVVGAGRAARAGVLFKEARALQLLSHADIVILDKTGTLTLGAPSVLSIVAMEGINPDLLLAIAASVEQKSEHVLARAIVQEAKGKNLTLLPCLDFEAVPGLGVKAVVDGKKIAIGSARFLKECGITIPREQEENGKNSLIFVAIDEAFAGLAKVGDELRPSARAAIDFLHAQGIRTIIASGDSETAVRESATALGVTEIFAGLAPAEKTALVKTLQAKKNTVVMVGDGINDAPALAQADVGIALSSGTDVAIGTADIVIISGDIAGVVRAYKLSKAMMANVAQNLALAFAYNIIAIPIASGVLIPVLRVMVDPMIAAAAMSISSVTVILNALRLRALRL
jgi:Cu+-exporting ATPase